MLLSGWKSIANYLQCGVRSAQRWENEFNLPVRRPAGGERHLVFAFSQELDDWVRRMNPMAEPQGSITLRQAELRKELADLRVRQRQLTAQLRDQMRLVKQGAANRNSHVHTFATTESLQAHLTQDRQALQYRTVLTVDDDAGNCYAITRILRNAGFNVFEAHNGQRALEVATKEHPDLALLDIHLPDFTGFELFALLQRDARTKNIPVIFHTASAPPDAASYIVESLNAEGLIRYPIEPASLVTLVRAAILRNLAA